MLVIASDEVFSHDSYYGDLLVSLAVFSSLVTVVAMCLCCYGQSDEDEADSAIADSDIEAYAKMSLMSGSSLRLPDQEVAVARVQPNLQHQSSINKKLGVRSHRHMSADDTDAEIPDISADDDSDSSVTSHLAASIAGPYPVLGRIQVTLRYDFEKMKLNLQLISAEHLPAKDFSGTSDPYVKIMLLPDRKRRLVSNIRRKSLNPRWDEMFSFEGYPYAKLADKTLCLQVLDYDRFSRDDPIGEVFIPLRDVNIASGVTLWQPLQPCYGEAGKLGQILVSLCYLPSSTEIAVGIVSARALLAKDINGLSDPYVKVWLANDGKRIQKQKTRCKPKTLSPDFNETFKFKVTSEQLTLTSLLISVMDRDIVAQNELIGQITLGPNSGPTEVRHWKEMLSKPQQTIERWHVLKNSCDGF